jgi:hypothetical protein
MKKVLLGSTALLGAAMIFASPAAAEMEVNISGFLKAEFWGVDQDVDDARDYVFGVDDSEFHVKAKNTADNGLTYGVNLEFELQDDVSMDEGYLWFSGDNWGTLQFGGNDGVLADMPYSGDFSLTAAFGYDGGLGAVWNFQNSIYFPSAAGTSDDQAKINYYSPRFSGIQLGVTYQPDSGQAQVGSDSLSASDGDDEDVFQVGLNFVDTINGIDIGIGGAYSTSSIEDGSGVAGVSQSAGNLSLQNLISNDLFSDDFTDLTTAEQAIVSAAAPSDAVTAVAELEDTEGIHVGFNVGFSGFSFGASYGDNFDSGCVKGVSGCDGGNFYEVAGAYATGPFTVSLGWFHGERDLTTTTDEETDIISIGAKYALAPGAVIIGEVNFVDEDGTGTTKNDGTTYMVGTQISF